MTSSPSARLSYTDFEIAIKAFLDQVNGHLPWTFCEYKEPRSESSRGYLALSHLQHTHKVADAENNEENGSTNTSTDLQLLDLASIGDDLEDEEDESQLSVSKDGAHDEFLSVSYHIVFSPSYQVPVLYFNAFKSNDESAPVGLEHIYQSLVPHEWRDTVRNAGLSGGISQQDHPIFNIPYYYMHPCETVSLMETVLKANQNRFDSQEAFLKSYIAAWLSFTGQAIGLSLPIEIARE
ncbi:hypothetical protein BGZ52_012797 [Haplosporangium bisporale]|nr:hypothetical protein BGZ52_012797 [Haplosporangium bisporale]KFH70377.1 hypothetical protein MVEG_03227 [Podila verticillata NRRL 6337]